MTNSLCQYFAGRMAFELPKLNFLYITGQSMYVQSMYNRCTRTRFLPPNFLEFRAFTKERKVVIFGLPKEILKIYSIEIFSRFHVDNMMFFQGIEDD